MNLGVPVAAVNHDANGSLCCGVTLDPFDSAQETAGSRGMDIDVIGAPISQSTIQQPFYIGAVANVPEIV